MHFSVLVVGDDIASQLAPFQENNMGDCPSKYMEFEPEIDFQDGEYAREKIVKETKERKLWQNEKEADRQAKLRFYQDSTLEEVIKEYHGYEFNKEEKAWGYMTNPQSEWDWYVVGGRWRGFFPRLADTDESLAVKGDADSFGSKPFPFLHDSIHREAIDMEVFEDFYQDGAKQYLEKNKFRIQTRVFGSHVTEDFVKQNASLYVKALLHEGEWIDGDSFIGNWEEHLIKLIKDADNEQLFTIVDCHV